MTDRDIRSYTPQDVFQNDNLRAFDISLAWHTWLEDTRERLTSIGMKEDDAFIYLRQQFQLHQELGVLDEWRESFDGMLDEQQSLMDTQPFSPIDSDS